MEQTMILVDNKDHILGYAPRTVCHTGKGKRHRAFVILLYNNSGQLLLQKRKHWLWDKYWDMTAASHPLRLKGISETYNQSASRCLRNEMNINIRRFRNVGSFNYFKRYGESCENEHCALLIAKYNGSVRPNSKHAYGYRWLDLKELVSEMKKSLKLFTPWLIAAVKILKRHPVRAIH